MRTVISSFLDLPDLPIPDLHSHPAAACQPAPPPPLVPAGARSSASVAGSRSSGPDPAAPPPSPPAATFPLPRLVLPGRHQILHRHLRPGLSGRRPRCPRPAADPASPAVAPTALVPNRRRPKPAARPATTRTPCRRPRLSNRRLSSCRRRLYTSSTGAVTSSPIGRQRALQSAGAESRALPLGLLPRRPQCSVCFVLMF